MFKIRFYVLSFGLVFAYDLGAPSPKITDSDREIDSELVLQSQLQNYSKASITIAYAVMVARVEGGGDGRPTPTIIEIDLVRNKISRLQSSRRSSGAFHCIPHM